MHGIWEGGGGHGGVTARHPDSTAQHGTAPTHLEQEHDGAGAVVGVNERDVVGAHRMPHPQLQGNNVLGRHVKHVLQQPRRGGPAVYRA
jgi:hypothetical protein